jgi:hypothetical protein
MDRNDSRGYFFEMADIDRRELVSKARSLSNGDSIETAVALLGPPMRDKDLVRKNGEFVTRVLLYYTKKWEESLVNERHDRYIRLEFDVDDRLERTIWKLDFTDAPDDDQR